MSISRELWKVEFTELGDCLEVGKKKDEKRTPGFLAWEIRQERDPGPREGVQEGSRQGGRNSHMGRGCRKCLGNMQRC